MKQMLKGIAKQHSLQEKKEKVCLNCGMLFFVTTKDTETDKVIYANITSKRWQERLFCSVECARKYDNRLVKVCPICKKEFKRSRNGNKGRGIYCSVKCVGLSRSGRNNPRWSGGQYDHVCKNCGNGFKSDRKNAIYCSYRCRGSSVKTVTRGYRAENRARNYLRKKGYYVIRSAGSMGIFDLVAFNDIEIRFIQVKKMKDIYYNRIEHRLSDFFADDLKQIKLITTPNISCISKEFWVYTDKKREPIIMVIK